MVGTGGAEVNPQQGVAGGTGAEEVLVETTGVEHRQDYSETEWLEGGDIPIHQSNGRKCRRRFATMIRRLFGGHPQIRRLFGGHPQIQNDWYSVDVIPVSCGVLHTLDDLCVCGGLDVRHVPDDLCYPDGLDVRFVSAGDHRIWKTGEWWLGAFAHGEW